MSHQSGMSDTAYMAELRTRWERQTVRWHTHVHMTLMGQCSYLPCWWQGCGLRLPCRSPGVQSTGWSVPNIMIIRVKKSLLSVSQSVNLSVRKKNFKQVDLRCLHMKLENGLITWQTSGQKCHHWFQQFSIIRNLCLHLFPITDVSFVIGTSCTKHAGCYSGWNCIRISGRCSISFFQYYVTLSVLYL